MVKKIVKGEYSSGKPSFYPNEEILGGFPVVDNVQMGFDTLFAVLNDSLPVSTYKEEYAIVISIVQIAYTTWQSLISEHELKGNKNESS